MNPTKSHKMARYRRRGTYGRRRRTYGRGKTRRVRKIYVSRGGIRL